MKRICIIGCGIVGAAIAYELSLMGDLEITVCDGQTPASGSTGAALGVLMGAISQKKPKSRAWKLRQASLQRYETLIPELERQLQRQLPRNDNGILKLGAPDENWPKWQKLAEVRQEQGFPLEIWSLETVRSRFPQLGTDGFSGAVFSWRDRQIQPIPLTQALVDAARQNGVRFEFGTEILEAEVVSGDKQRCQRLHARNGSTYDVDTVIVSAGVGTTLFCENLGDLVTVKPVLGQALRFRLSQPFPEDFPVVTGGDVHVVPLSDVECWVGATVEFPDDSGQVTANSHLLETVKQEAIALYPPLADAEILETWHGSRPRPEGRSAPVIDVLPNYENVLLATGHYRNGVLLAPATAECVRDWIVKNC